MVIASLDVLRAGYARLTIGGNDFFRSKILNRSIPSSQVSGALVEFLDRPMSQDPHDQLLLQIRGAVAVKDNETERSAIAFLREAAKAFPFRLTHVLTNNGSCFTFTFTFTFTFARVCAELGAEYRHTRPYSPQTNGMVERFNGRVGSEVLGITIWFHADLEQLLRGFNAAYNARRQRVLDGRTPDQVVKDRLRARRKLARPKPEMPEGRAGPEDIVRARRIAEDAKEVSQPDT
jgi:hypothetical protein